MPILQDVYNTLTVTNDKVSQQLSISFRTNNCTSNLQPLQIGQNLNSVSCLFKIKNADWNL